MKLGDGVQGDTVNRASGHFECVTNGSVAIVGLLFPRTSPNVIFPARRFFCFFRYFLGQLLRVDLITLEGKISVRH